MKKLLICLITVTCYGMDDQAAQELGIYLMSLRSTPQERCGICNQAAPNTPWISHNSKFAHHNCIKYITPAFHEAINKLDSAFRNNINLWNKAHIHLIRLIQENIGNNKTIFEYLQQTNIRALKSVVDMYVDDTINCVHEKSL